MQERSIGSPESIDLIIGQVLRDKSKNLDPDNIRSEHWVDMGQDSSVIKIDDKIYKFYGRGFSGLRIEEDQVRLYQAVTNKTLELVHTRKFVLWVTSEMNYRFRVNPITKVLKSDKYQVVVGVSPYVAGLSVDKAGIASAYSVGEFLDKVGADISNELGVKGVRLEEYNVKVQNGWLVATDLCPRVTSLGKFV